MRRWTIGVLLLVCFDPTCGVLALVPDSAVGPYGIISKRNVFRLQAPMVQATNDAAPPIVLPKVTLTGTATILGFRTSFITIAGAKHGEAPESVMLAEGQAFNGIEVRSIDARAGVVQIVNHGEMETLDFERNGAKTGEGLRVPDAGPPKLPVSPGPPPSGSVQTLSPEEQIALIELQRVKFKEQRDPMATILPHTELTDEMNGDASPEVQ